MKTITWKQYFLSFLFSLLLSETIIVGTQVHYVDIRASFTENYIRYDWGCIMQGFLLAVIIFPITVFLFDLQKDMMLRDCKPVAVQGNRRFFFIAWAVIFVGWIPYLLSFYPGGLVGDGVEVVRMALTPGLPKSSHWSILYVLILKAVINLGGMIFDDLNDCLFVYTIIESIFFSCSCAFICSNIRQRFYKIRFLPYLSLVMFAVSGFLATYSMTFWADGIFGSFIVFLCVLQWNIIGERQTSRSNIIKMIVLNLLICLWRNNGLYIIAFVLVSIAVLLKRKGVKLIVSGLFSIIIVLIIKGPVFNALDISKDSLRESISIPEQQLAAVINSGHELSSEQEDILFTLAPKEVWLNNYCPTLSDDIKFNINQDYLSHHLGSFIKVWMELLPSNLDTYLQAYLMQTIGFWKLNSFQGNYWDYWYGVTDYYNFGLHEKDLIESTFGISIRPILIKNMRYISSGTVIWIMIFSFCSILYQGKELQRLLVLMPLAGCWLTVMLATPIAYAYRYVLPLAMMLPIIVFFPVFSITSSS